MELSVTNNNYYASCICPRSQPGSGMSGLWKSTKRKGTHKTEHIKVNFRLHILKRIYTAASSSGHLPPLHSTVHYMKHKSLDGAFIIRCSSHRSSSKLARNSGPATVAEVPYMECFICKRKYHVEAEMRVAIIQGFLSSDSTRRNC